MVRANGLKKTWELAQRRQNTPVPTGYSAAGVVLEVGAGVSSFFPGDRVACAGSQHAFHAELIRVPQNLVVSVPEEVNWDEASTVTLGAIALQGVRRAGPTLGETFVVIGLGVLGQLTTQILRANGCRTIAVDLDPARLESAKLLGANLTIAGDESLQTEEVARATDGIGADGVIITAATQSDAVISTAFRMCRKKGRVVLVGDVGLELNRADFYEKELDFLISTSYGPGRYDRRYEEEGLDYPVGYVRWTENRNLSEYLRLIAEKRVEVAPLIAATFPIDRTGDAYASLSTGSGSRPLVLLSYPEQPEERPAWTRKIHRSGPRTSHDSAIRIAVIGSGNFALATHLPNIRASSKEFTLRAVQSHTGHKAKAVAAQFGAEYSTTDSQEIIDDPEVDAVLISSRHNLHAALALECLRAGKHVLVEKPLAMTEAESEDIRTFFESATSSVVLFTGFNRRFSPYARKLAMWLPRRTAPMILNYTMNAGYLPPDHWVHGPAGGGRNIGEACHVYDLFNFLTDATVQRVSAAAIRPRGKHYLASDNFCATLSFSDGSLATLIYCALGSADYPKETLEIFVDGRVIVLNDYREMTTYGRDGIALRTKHQEKGHREELAAFASAIRKGANDFPVEQQLDAMAAAFEVEKQLTSRSAP